MNARTLTLAAIAALLLHAGSAFAGSDGAGRRMIPRAADAVSADLLTGWRTANGGRMAALHLVLAEGWKTYWRAPGEAGIPPSFDWSRSSNLGSVAYHWPTPGVFKLNGMRTIGYRQELVLPIEITPIDPSRPVTLAGDLDIGVCRDICMPVSLTLNAVLPVAEGARDERISTALASAPKSGAQSGLSSLTCTVEPIADGLRITARMQLTPLGGEEMAVFETGDPTIWVSEAASQREGRTFTASADLVATNGGAVALNRSALRMTLLGRGNAVEVMGCPAG